MIYACHIIRLHDASPNGDTAPNFVETDDVVLTVYGRTAEDATTAGREAARLWEANHHEAVEEQTPVTAEDMRCDWCDAQAETLRPVGCDHEFGVDHEVMASLACADCLVTEELIEYHARRDEPGTQANVGGQPW